MSSVICFQYTPCSKLAAVSRLMRRMFDLGCTPVLDIEDSVQDTLHPELTPSLKQEARDSLVAFLKEGRLNLTKPIGLRINAISTDEFERDIAMLSQARTMLNLHSIWLPMVDSGEVLVDVDRVLRKAGVDFQQLIPIVETVAGRDNLEDICSARFDINLNYIHYGHYDFSLDAGHWPLIQQDDEVFWANLEPMISMVESSGLTYIHTPFGDLGDDDLFNSVSGYLEKVCSKPFGRTALNLHQSQLISGFTEADHCWRRLSFSDVEKMSFAKKIIEIFENNQVSKRSFSAYDQKFITPHEYKLAQKYIQSEQ